MEVDNMLQHSQGHYSANWERTEAMLWSRSIQRSVCVAMIVGCVFRVVAVLATGVADLVTLAVASGVLVFSIYMFQLPLQSSLSHQHLFTVFLQVIQGYSLYIGTVVLQKYFLVWCITSSVVFCLFEIPSFMDWRWVLPLLIRQLAMWQTAALYLEKGQITLDLPYFMLGGVIGIVLCFAHENRKKTLEKYKFCDSVEEERSKLRNILQAIPEGLAVIVESLEAPCVNAQLHTILKPGKRTVIETLKGVHCDQAEDDLGLLVHIKRFLKEEGVVCKTFGVTEQQGSYFEWKGTKCMWGDKMACILTVSDITSWVEAKTRLEEESESKSALLSFVSHELRTPTNAILNLVSSVMVAGNITPEQNTDLSIVVTSTHFLLSVTNDLLDFSRMVANKFNLVKQRFDIRKELGETIQLVELQCTQKGLFLRLKVDNFVPEIIYTDPNRLKQVLLNLLGNAVKFTFQGGIRVICMVTNHSHLRITVKDTGIGIPPSKIASLCKAFSTIEATQGINPQGCGLGLYISNLLAQCLGGRPIDITSIELVGSEFSFEVNIYEESWGNVTEGCDDITSVGIEDEKDGEIMMVSKSWIGGKGDEVGELPMVLVVDDSDFNRVVLIKMLESFHIRADQVNTGLRALTVIRENAQRGHLYRLVLMDVEMPEMDGLAAAKEIRTMELTGELMQGPKIVACSAHRSSDEYARCIHAGMNDYIEKPISRSKLQKVLSFLLPS